MEEWKTPGWDTLSNGVVVPNEEILIFIHDRIIKYRKEELNQNDPANIRDRGVLRHLCDTLKDQMHKYKNDPIENALYVATEIFYYIACQHPFFEANKTTAYVAALTSLELNRILNFNYVGGKMAQEVFGVKTTSAPKEAEEITRLAERGERSEAEIKKLIKGFLSKYVIKC